MTAVIDGRIRRGTENRKRIQLAFLELLRDGVHSPTAEQVAEKAGVGLRSVFRHFDDMEGLYREIGEAIGRMGVPVFLYGDLATDHDRRERAYFRAGGLDSLWQRMTSGSLAAGDSTRYTYEGASE